MNYSITLLSVRPHVGTSTAHRAWIALNQALVLFSHPRLVQLHIKLEHLKKGDQFVLAFLKKPNILLADSLPLTFCSSKRNLMQLFFVTLVLISHKMWLHV